MKTSIKKIFNKLFLKRKNKIKMIVAIDLENGIGKNQNLLFSFKKDMKHFTEKTMHSVVIMGSRTYESIPEKFRPLKKRVNIILSRNNINYAKDVFIAKNIEEALRVAQKYNKEIWIIGGARVYQQMISYADELEITQIFTKKEADTFFPGFKNDFELVKTSRKMISKQEEITFQFQTWKRK